VVISVQPFSISKWQVSPRDTFLLAIRFIGAVGLLDFKHTFLWNTIYVCAIVPSYAVLPQECPLMISTYTFAVNQIFCFALLAAVAYSTEMVGTSLIRQMLEAKVLRDDHSAVRSLLDAMCDAVVMIDENYRITESSPRLACMLMYDPNVQMSGKSMLDYFAVASERDLYIERTRNCTQADYNIPRGREPVETTVFHTTLLDSHGNRINVEVFHVRVQYIDIDSFSLHIIGIREEADVTVQHGIQNMNFDYAAMPSEDCEDGQIQLCCDALSYKVEGCSLGLAKLASQASIGDTFDMKQLFSLPLNSALRDRYENLVDQFACSDFDLAKQVMKGACVISSQPCLSSGLQVKLSWKAEMASGKPTILAQFTFFDVIPQLPLVRRDSSSKKVGSNGLRTRSKRAEGLSSSSASSSDSGSEGSHREKERQRQAAASAGKGTKRTVDPDGSFADADRISL